MLARRRLSGFAILSLITTSYWLILTFFIWFPAPGWLVWATLLPALGMGMLLAACPLSRRLTPSIDFALSVRGGTPTIANPTTTYDRVLTSLIVLLTVLLGVSIPFAVGLVSGVLGMRQAGRSRRFVRGYALAASCVVTGSLGAAVFLTGTISSVLRGSALPRRLCQNHGADGTECLFGLDPFYRVSRNEVMRAMPPERAAAVSYHFHAAGRQVATRDALGKLTTSVYDAAGRRTALVDALGNRTTFVYDTASRLTAEVDPLSQRTTYVYDGRNLLSSLLWVEPAWAGYAAALQGSRAFGCWLLSGIQQDSSDRE